MQPSRVRFGCLPVEWEAIQGKRTLTNFFGWWILLEAVSDNLASKDMVGLIL